MKTCPHCKSQDIREYFTDNMSNELNQEQINDLTTHEKEIAAECQCNECGYSDAADYFPYENHEPSIFENVANIIRPMNLNLSMQKVY